MNEAKPTYREYPDGTKQWRLYNRLHREGATAIEWANGTKSWYLNGQLHREDGPAHEDSDGRKYWYLNDVCYYEEEDYWKELFNRGIITEKELFLKLL